MASAPSQKSCPVCGTPNPANARFCNQCGAALGAATDTGANRAVNAPTEAPIYGDNDLMETELPWRMGVYLFSGAGMLALLLLIGLIFWLRQPPANIAAPIEPNSIAQTQTQQNAAAPLPVTQATRTPRPTTFLPTVTPAPPTETLTPTQGPCEIEVRPNDSLISIVAQCGHRDLAIIDQVLELNGLSDASVIQLGQIIQVPRPTPTVDPNVTPDEEAREVSAADNNSGGFASVILAEGAEGLPSLTPRPTATLPAGVQWHTIMRDENIITISFTYGADLEVLSQLNPEVTFSQCDFGKATGGPNCIVQLFEGQRIRVPAPTPTPTLEPTASGSETPTPTATPTFNAPNLVSPGDRVPFTRNELVTLRWAGTGTLGEGEVYRVTVTNRTLDRTYTADTRETTFVLPTAWQAGDGQRHEYTWFVSVIDLSNPDDPQFTTEPRTFMWDALRPPATQEG